MGGWETLNQNEDCKPNCKGRDQEQLNNQDDKNSVIYHWGVIINQEHNIVYLL